MHSPGFAFMANSDQDAPIDEDLQFMSNHNLGTGFGAICASLPKPLSNLELGDFPCQLILHQGVFCCPTTRKLSHLYYKWAGNICPYANLFSCMNAKTLTLFIKEGFPPCLCHSCQEVERVLFESNFWIYFPCMEIVFFICHSGWQQVPLKHPPA